MIRFAGAGDDVGGRLEFGGEFLEQKQFLVGLARAGNDGDRTRRSLLELPADLRDGGGPAAGALYFGEAILAFDPFVIQSARIAHPWPVHRIIIARFIAVHGVFARADHRVAAGAAAGAEAVGFLEEPYAHLEPEILGGQRTDRADVSGVERVIIVKRRI